MATTNVQAQSPKSPSTPGKPQRLVDREVRWRENTEERAKHRATTSVDIMTYYLENCHKPKPTHSPGFKRLKDKNIMIVPEPTHKDIFPKYPLPVNFLSMQHHHILHNPPVRRPVSSPSKGESQPIIRVSQAAEETAYSSFAAAPSRAARQSILSADLPLPPLDASPSQFTMSETGPDIEIVEAAAEGVAEQIDVEIPLETPETMEDAVVTEDEIEEEETATGAS